MSNAQLTLGAVDLMGSPGSPFNIYALGTDSGTTWGNPAPIEVQLRSFLQDGAVVLTSGYDNREQFIAVEIDGDDLTAVAAAEAALFAELGKQNTLTYTPPGGTAPATVFDVMTSSLDQLSDDLAEAMQGNRNYLIRLVSLPWARSDDEVVVPAVGTGVNPAAPTLTSVDDCTATTNWTRGGDANSGPTVVTGAVQVARTSGPALPGEGRILTATRSSLSANMSTTPYLRITASLIDTGFWSADSPTFTVNGASMAVAARAGSDYYLDCTAMTVTSVVVTGVFTGAGVGSGTATVRVDDISRTDQIVGIGTTRQLQRSIAISGSTRTQATLAIEHTTSALGDVIAYVFDSSVSPAYSPPLRQYRAGGGSVSVDTSSVSGATETLATSPFFDIPVSALPSGLDEVDVRVKATSSNATYALTVTAQTRINGVNVGQAVTMTTSEPLTTSAYKVVAVGVADCRQVNTPANSSAVVRITVSSPSGSAVTFDEGWLFNLRIGTLTMVACGTAAPSSGGTSNRLWLYPATISNDGIPTVRRGFAADGSDSFFPENMSAWGPPMFVPPSVGLFTVTTNALNAAASARYFPRWHTNAAA